MKFKNGFIKEHLQVQESQEEQRKLKEKHGIANENVVVVEKKFLLKFLLLTIGKIISTIAIISLLILAAIGILSLVYPEPRSEMLILFDEFLKQFRMLINFEEK